MNDFARLALASIWITAAAACASNPTEPTTTGGGSPTSSVAAPLMVSAQPGNNAQVRFVDQPVVLTVPNAVVTGSATTTYTYEVATDSAFSKKVQTRDAVPEGSNGQTSVRLDALTAGDYFWHVRAQGGGTTGVFSSTFKFTVGVEPIVINAATPIGPANGATAVTWPTMTVGNATRSGPAGSLVYRYEISTTPTFAAIVVTGTAPEGSTQTSFTPPAAQAPPTQPGQFFWRVTVLDQTNAVSGPSSPFQSFVINAGIPITPLTGTATVTWPTITASDVPRSVPSGPLLYRFEVAPNAAFSPITQTATVAETANQTSFTPPASQAPPAQATQAFWRVTVIDSATGASGPASSVQSFVINAASPLSPPAGTSVSAWPTFTVNNVVRTGTVGPLAYRFDFSTTAALGSNARRTAAFSTPLLLSGTVPEGSNQTSFTPPAATPVPSPGTQVFWQVTVIDQRAGASGPPSTVASITFIAVPKPSNPLWPGTQPPGTNGHAVLGDNWQTQTFVSFNGVTFTSPQLDQLQVFDLIDRGMDPQAAIDWMHANGYPTQAAWFPGLGVIGFPYSYMALIGGRWDLVIRNGA